MSKKPFIISTGFLNSKEINQLIKNLIKIRKTNMAILHCISSCPAEPNEVNMLSIKNLKNNFGLEIDTLITQLELRLAYVQLALSKNY